MVTCELCGRQFKNTQGLRGHKTFFHSDGSSNSVSATQTTTEMLLSQLERRLEQLEYATGLREASILDKTLNIEKPLTEKLTEVTKQVNSIIQQLTSLSSNTTNSEFRRMNEQISQLTHQLSTYSKWFQPVRTVAGTMSRLEDELSNRARNTRVNTLENRLARLEEVQEKAEEIILKCIRGNKEVNDFQINKVMEAINNVVDKLATSIKHLQSQFVEQKRITDWVKKENNLRTVQKVR